MNKVYIVLGLVTLIGCGSSSPAGGGGGAGGSGGSGLSPGNGGSAGNSAVCVSGQQVACACPGGIEGAQACKADGSGYLACDCTVNGAGGANAGGDAGMSSEGGDAGAGGDAATSGAGASGTAGSSGTAGAGGSGGGTGGGGAGGAIQGALRVAWTLGQDSCPQAYSLNCGQVSAQTIEVDLTLMGASSSLALSAPCPSGYSNGEFDVGPIPFGTYTVVVSAVNASDQAVANSGPLTVSFDASNCTFSGGSKCGRTIAGCLIVN